MKKKLLITAVSTAVVLSLVLGVGLPGFAAADQAQNQETANIARRAINGEVVQIDSGKTFFVVKAGDKEVKIGVDNNTKYFKLTVPQKLGQMVKEQVQERKQDCFGGRRFEQKPKPKRFGQGGNPGTATSGTTVRAPWFGIGPITVSADEPPERLPAGLMNGVGLEALRNLRNIGEPATFDDIAIGDRVRVRVAPNGDTPLAEVVLIVKPVSFKSIKGTVSAVAGNFITITGEETVTVTYDGNTHVVLKGAIAVQQGQTIHAVYNSETMVAKMIRVQPAQ